MGMTSKTKGKVGEREVAALLKDNGFEARRGQQFAGGGDSPDVVHNIPGVHIEVKRTERLDMWGALAQATADSAPGEIATVFHRPNKRPWVVILPAQDFLDIMAELVEATAARQ